jgi:hypothetical protein
MRDDIILFGPKFILVDVVLNIHQGNWTKVQATLLSLREVHSSNIQRRVSRQGTKLTHYGKKWVRGKKGTGKCMS